MPLQDEESLNHLLDTMFPGRKEAAKKAFIGLYLDLQKKAGQAEMSTKALDLRGMIGALRTVRAGLSPWQAVKMGIVNKCFDLYEKEIIQDAAMTRIPEEWSKGDVF